MTSRRVAGSGLLFLTLCLGLPATPGTRSTAHAQTQPFRSGVTLLTLDVSVLDADGAPVPGLTAADFEVDLNGRRSPVKTVDYVVADARRRPSVSAPPGPSGGAAVAQTPAARSGPLDRTVLLFVDDLSFGPLEHKALTTAAERFLGTLGPQDRVGLMTSSGRQSVVPNVNRGPLAAGLRNIAGRFVSPQRDAVVRAGDIAIEGDQIALSEAIDIARNDLGVRNAVARREAGDRCVASDECTRAIELLAGQIARSLESHVQQQARAWVAAAEALSRVEGPKVLVVMGGGIASELTGGALRPLTRAVARSGIALHVLAGTRSAASAEDRMFVGSSGTGQDRRARDNAMFLAGLRDAAASAGGLVHVATGTVDDEFSRILLATSARYRLGVEVASDLAAGAVVKTQVRTGNGRLRVFAASEYTTPGPSPVLSTEQQLRAIVSQGDAYFALPVSLTTLVRRHPNATSLELGLHLEAPATAPPPLDVVFGVFNDVGRVVQSGRTRIERTSAGDTQAFALAVPVPPGNYRVRVGVADSAGTVGSSEHTVAARLTVMGGLMASQLFTRATGPGDRVVVLAGDAIPESASHLDVGLELYRGANSGADIMREARIALATATGETMQERTVALAGADAAWYAGVRLPLDVLPAGRYAVSFKLVEAGAVVAEVSRGLTKTADASASAAGSVEAPGREAVAGNATATALPRLTPGLPSPDDVLAILRRDTASRRPAPDVARLIDKAAVALHLGSVPGPRAGTVPKADVPDDTFWASVDMLARGTGPQADFARGVAAIRQQDWATAVTSLERTLEAEPDALVALQYLGATHAGIGEDRDAAGAWALSLQATSASAGWHLAHADVLVRIQDQAAAIDVLTDAVSRWPDDSRVRARRAELLIAVGRVDEARVDLDITLARAPTDERALFLATALAFGDVAGRPVPDVVAKFERLSSAYLAVVRDATSPVAEWRRLVAAIPK